MNKAIQIRFVIGVVLIGILLIGYQWLKNAIQDPDTGDFKSVGYVAALEMTKDGGRAVIFDDTGKRIDPLKPAKEDFDDREISWSVDGQRLFISSTRDSTSFLVHRWNPATNAVEKRAIGSRSQSAPWFWPAAPKGEQKLGLLQSGGQILELDTTGGTTQQILPPAFDPMATDQEEGRRGTMEVLYGKFGESFTMARYAGDKTRIVGIMLNDEGQTAIVHLQGTNSEGQLIPPFEIFRGKKVGLDVSADGRIALMVRNMAFADPANVPEEFIKDGKVVKPFESGLFIVGINDDGSPAAEPIALLPPGTTEAFGDISISPDGTKIAVTIGVVDEMGGFTPRGMMVMPFESNGGGKATPVIGGMVSSMSWSPDGEKLAFLKTEGSETNVFVIGVNGAGERKLTSGGTYSMPMFSPQAAK